MLGLIWETKALFSLLSEILKLAILINLFAFVFIHPLENWTREAQNVANYPE